MSRVVKNKRLIADCTVVAADCIIDERLGAEGSVEARRVVVKRGVAIGGVVGANLVAEERLVSTASVSAAGGVA